MNKVLTLATALATGIFASLAHPADHYELSPHIGPPETRVLGSGLLTGCGKAPGGGDPSVKINSKSGGGSEITGYIKVTIDGNVVPKNQYDVTDIGTSCPELTFHKAPAKDAVVCLTARVKSGDKTKTDGELEW